MCYNYAMQELNEIIANNICLYRKQKHLTQAELGEMVNFSDKSISKWEKGESLPDIVTLKKLCDIFGITLNDLASMQVQKKENKNKSKKLLITLLSVGLVWLIATTVFVVLLLAFPGVQKSWMCYIYALPVSAIVLVVFSALWAKPIWQFLSSTILIWTTLVSICLSISDIWYLLLIGAPLEILLFLLFVLKKK